MLKVTPGGTVSLVIESAGVAAGGIVFDVCGDVVVPLVAEARLVTEPKIRSSCVTTWLAVQIMSFPGEPCAPGTSVVGVAGHVTVTRLSLTVNGALSVVLPVLRTKYS